MGGYAPPVAITVLVVDDTAHVRRMLTTMLDIDGFEVVGDVDSGPAAVAATARLDPDVVVMDYRMAGTTGLEAAREIKGSRPGQHVILYTAFAEPEVEAEAAEIGVAVCVAKAEGIAVLESEIRRLAGG